MPGLNADRRQRQEIGGGYRDGVGEDRAGYNDKGGGGCWRGGRKGGGGEY